MNGDLLTNDFSKDIDFSKIKTNVTLVKTILIIGSIIYILVFFRWFKLTTNAFSNKEIWNKLFVFYTITITSRVMLSMIFVSSWLYYLKANKLIKDSFIQNEPELFNKAYRFINITSTLTIIGNIISLIEVIASFFV